MLLVFASACSANSTRSGANSVETRADKRIHKQVLGKQHEDEQGKVSTVRQQTAESKEVTNKRITEKQLDKVHESNLASDKNKRQLAVSGMCRTCIVGIGIHIKYH